MQDNAAVDLSADASYSVGVDQIIAVVKEELRSGSLDIPSLPDVAVRIGRVVSDSDTDNADIARIIHADPALAARFLCTVNSPAYVGRVKAERLADAVGRMGRERTRSIVVALVLRTAFRTRSAVVHRRMEKLWKHSGLIAALCGALTRSVKHLDSDKALLAGLMHDIGLIPLLRKAAQYPQLTDHPEAMERYLASLRSACSAYLLRRWGFAEDLIEAAREAQHCSRSHDHQSDYTDMVIIAHLIALSTQRRNRHSIPFDRVPAVAALSRDMKGSFSLAEFLDDARQHIRTMQGLLAG